MDKKWWVIVLTGVMFILGCAKHRTPAVITDVVPDVPTATYTFTALPVFTPTPTATNSSSLSRISGMFIRDGSCTANYAFKNQEVQLYPLGLTTTTDSVTGEFVFYNVPDGSYTLKLTYGDCWVDLRYGNPMICMGEEHVNVTGQDIIGLLICPVLAATITPTLTKTPTPIATFTPTPTPTPV